jgi:hypothetical protein
MDNPFKGEPLNQMASFRSRNYFVLRALESIQHNAYPCPLRPHAGGVLGENIKSEAHPTS